MPKDYIARFKISAVSHNPEYKAARYALSPVSATDAVERSDVWLQLSRWRSKLIVVVPSFAGCEN